jgi:sec-independent protein translocase protein TatA
MSLTAVPLFGPVPGGPELLIILLIAILLFGASKVPKLARSSGKAIGEFKKGRREMEEELEELTGQDIADDGESSPGDGDDDGPLGSADSGSGTTSERT